MTTYRIEPAPGTLHGTFSRDYPPILTIDSGDRVLFRTLNAGWVLEPPSSAKAQAKQFEPRIQGRDDGHALCGPIAMRGAQPGMTLEIRINEVRPAWWVLAAGLAVAAVAFWRQKPARQRPSARRISPNAVPGVAQVQSGS